MAYRIADLDAEAEVLLTRAEWYEARRRLYGMGFPRDDAHYPLPVPPGATWARRVTGVQAVDQARVGSSTVRFQLLYDAPAEDRVVPNVEGVGAAGYEHRPLDDLVGVTATIAPNLAATLSPDPRAWIGRWVVNTGSAPQRPMGPAPDPSWWTGTRWAQQISLAFLPPQPASGPFSGGGQVSDVVPFGDALQTDVVLVRSPHPYLPKEAIERQRAGPDVVVGMAPNAALRTPVRSRGLSFVRGPGNTAQRTEHGWLGKLYRRVEPSGLESVVESIEQTVSNVAHTAAQAGRNLARAVSTGDLDALQALAAAALVVAVTGGLGAGALGQVLQGTSVAGSDDPWRAAARVGAVHYAFFVSPLTQGLRSGNVVDPLGGSASASQALASNPVAAGVTDLSVPTYSIAGVTATADDVAAAEVWVLRLTAVSPEAANALLQALARGTSYFGGYVDLVFARLVIEAEADDRKRAALKAELATAQAVWWNDYGQYIALALAAVATALGAGPIAAAGFALLQSLYQAGIAAANLEVALDAARRAELAADREMREIEAEIARLEAEIAGMGGLLPAPPGTDATVPVPTGMGPEPWYEWLLTHWSS